MHVFLTGAAGYIGGAVAVRLLRDGHRVSGLTRRADTVAALAALGIDPVVGDLDATDLLADCARAADAVVHTAEANHPTAARALLDALAGSGKAYVHTSGSGIVADHAAGAYCNPRIHDENSVPDVHASMQVRDGIDRAVLAEAARGVRSIVIRPSLIYGDSPGLHRDSFQVPVLIAQARDSGVPRHVGAGLNVWSHVHIDDTADLYALALDHARAGSLFYAEHGEAAMVDTVERIGRMLGLDTPPQPWPLDVATAYWGPRTPVALGSNSRVRGRRARAELGWAPRGPSLADALATGTYAQRWRPA